VSSRDRHYQSNFEPYDDEVVDESFDDALLDEEWASDPYEQTRPTPRTTSTRGSSGSSPYQYQREAQDDGTAAQLDRLRQAMRQPAQPRPPATTTRTSSTRPAPGWRPERQIPPPAQTEWDDDYDPTPTYRTAPAPSTTARTRSTYQPDPYVDEDQGWDDEYYEEYEDDFSEYDNPRPAPRQRPQIAVPNLTVPSAIANAAIVGDRTALGLIGTSVAGLIAMAILTANQVDSLAPGFATHVSASGVFEDFRSEGALWNLPIMATMLTLMAMVIAWFVAPIDRFASRFVLGAALLVQFLAWVALIRLI